ncbi:MAG: hypothetical protein IJU15_00920 [Synergistaceae bacterium]|nr:hypothetical protein [Synergistaceae bacterium]
MKVKASSMKVLRKVVLRGVFRVMLRVAFKVMQRVVFKVVLRGVKKANRKKNLTLQDDYGMPE